MPEYAYKMTTETMKCRGVQYEPNVWYEEAEANCVQNGFHAAKNPLDCLSYYPVFNNSQCWIVEIGGDIDEDSTDSKVSATRICFRKRLTLPAFIQMACIWIMEHPEMPYNHNVTEGPAESNYNHFAISVSEEPRACGKLGDVLGILKTFPSSRVIDKATCFIVDGKTYMPNTWYDADGKEFPPKWPEAGGNGVWT